MSANLWPLLYGVLGGIIPGGIHLAWNITRGTKTSSGTIDFTLRKRAGK